MVLEIVVAFLVQFLGFFKQFGLTAKLLGFLFAQVVISFFQSGIVHLHDCLFAGTIFGRHLDPDDFLTFLVRLFPVFVLAALTRCFHVVIDNRQTAALVLKGLGYGIKPILYLSNFDVDLLDIGLNLFVRSLRFSVKGLVFRAFFYGSFAFGGFWFYAVEVAGIASYELSLNSLPRTLTVSLVVQCPD